MTIHIIHFKKYNYLINNTDINNFTLCLLIAALEGHIIECSNRV